MKRLLTSIPAVAVAVTVGACGGGGGDGGGGGTAAAGTAAPSGTSTVAVRQVSGVGRVLVDAAGKPVYESDLEASGKVVCDGTCTSFWMPVAATGHAAAPAGVGSLGVVKRPDGTRQLTAGGRPLYTFAEDSPGKATGDGFRDEFAGHHFTWHVVRSDGKASSGNSSSSGGGGAGAASGNAPPGYGY